MCINSVICGWEINEAQCLGVLTKWIRRKKKFFLKVCLITYIFSIPNPTWGSNSVLHFTFYILHFYYCFTFFLISHASLEWLAFLFVQIILLSALCLYVLDFDWKHLLNPVIFQNCVQAAFQQSSHDCSSIPSEWTASRWTFLPPLCYFCAFYILLFLFITGFPRCGDSSHARGRPDTAQHPSGTDTVLSTWREIGLNLTASL